MIVSMSKEGEGVESCSRVKGGREDKKEEWGLRLVSGRE